MNENVIWKALKKAGYNDYAAAGIIGNLIAESNLKPMNMQNSFEQSLGFNDTTYTKAVDAGNHDFVHDGVGYGLAQWTFWSRKEALLNYAKSINKSIGDLDMQIDFLIHELKGYTEVENVLRNAKNVREASDIVLLKYEQPANTSIEVQMLRYNYAMGIYQEFAVCENKDNTYIVNQLQQITDMLSDIIDVLI